MHSESRKIKAVPTWTSAPTARAMCALELVESPPTVLIIGWADTELARVLTGRGCVVSALVEDETAAEQARVFCTTVETIAALDSWAAASIGERFDAVVFDAAAVSVAPARILRMSRHLVGTAGQFIAVIPNIAHATRRAAVLNGYLDDTDSQKEYARAFTVRGVLDLFDAAGYSIERLERLRRPAVLNVRANADPESDVAYFALRARPLPPQAAVGQDAVSKSNVAPSQTELLQRLSELEARLLHDGDQRRVADEQVQTAMEMSLIVATHHTEIARLESCVADLRDRNAEIEAQLTDKADLSAKLAAEELLSSDLRLSLSDLEAKLLSSEELVRQLEQTLHLQEPARNELQDRLSEARAALAQADLEKIRITESLAESKSALVREIAVSNDFRTRLEQLESASAEKISSLESHLDERRRIQGDLEGRLESYVLELQHRNAEYEDQLADNTQLAARLAALDSLSQDLESQVSELGARLLSGDQLVQQLERKLREHELNQEDLRARLSAARAALEHSETKKAQIADSLAEAKTALFREESATNDLRIRLAQLESQSQSERIAFTEKIASLQSYAHERSRAAADLQVRIECYDEELAEHNARLDAQLVHNADLTARLAAAELLSTDLQAHVSDLEARVLVLGGRAESAECAVRDAATQAVRQQATIAEFEALQQGWTSRLSRLVREVAELKEQRDVAVTRTKKDARRLARMRAVLTRRIASLKGSLNESFSRHRQAEKHLRLEMSEVRSELNAQIVARESTIAQLSAAHDAAEHCVRILTAQAEHLTLERDVLSAELSRARDEMDTVRSETQAAVASLIADQQMRADELNEKVKIIEMQSRAAVDKATAEMRYTEAEAASLREGLHAEVLLGERLQNDVKNATSRIDALLAETQQLRDEKARLAADSSQHILRLDLARESLQREVETLSELLRSSREAYERATSERAALQVDAAVAEEVINGLRSEVAEEVAEYEQLANAYEQLEDRFMAQSREAVIRATTESRDIQEVTQAIQRDRLWRIKTFITKMRQWAKRPAAGVSR